MDVCVRPTIITRGLAYSLATGNWGEQKKAHQTRAGVSQVLNRLTYTATLSQLFFDFSFHFINFLVYVVAIHLLAAKENWQNLVSYTILNGEWSALQKHLKDKLSVW